MINGVNAKKALRRLTCKRDLPSFFIIFTRAQNDFMPASAAQNLLSKVLKHYDFTKKGIAIYATLEKHTWGL